MLCQYLVTLHSVCAYTLLSAHCAFQLITLFPFASSVLFVAPYRRTPRVKIDGQVDRFFRDYIGWWTRY